MRLPPLIMAFGFSAALIASLWCEWVIARMGGGSILVPPVTLLAAIAAMAALPFSLRIWCAAAAGFVLDSVGLPPFGAAMLLFIFLACMIEAARLVIADRASLFAKVAMAAGLYLLAYGAGPLARTAAGLLRL